MTFWHLYFDIYPGTTKETYINKILHRVETVHKNYNQLNKLLLDIRNQSTPDPAPLHSEYRKFFNLIDKVDKWWYSVADAHPNQNWRNKMLFAILRFAMINVWVYFSIHQYESWKDFRHNLICVFLK